jgi:nucleotide-binding universal stress UspA family protein
MHEQVSQYFDSLPENIDIKIVVKRGNPRDIICEYAKENEIDCIVMGRRGLSGIRGALGSVSTAVLRGTDLPVLVIK